MGPATRVTYLYVLPRCTTNVACSPIAGWAEPQTTYLSRCGCGGSILSPTASPALSAGNAGATCSTRQDAPPPPQSTLIPKSPNDEGLTARTTQDDNWTHARSAIAMTPATFASIFSLVLAVCCFTIICRRHRANAKPPARQELAPVRQHGSTAAYGLLATPSRHQTR